MARSRTTALLAVAAAALIACPKESGPAKRGEPCAADASCSSGLVCSDGRCAAPSRRYTFRAIAGVSMGAVGSSRLAARHPDAFDAAGFLGGPMDAALLARTLETGYLGGFCTREQLAAALALDQADHGNRLDRPDGVPGCTPAPAAPLTHYSYPLRYNHWHYTTNGGHFDRNASLDIFQDLMLALGNPAAPLVSEQQMADATCSQPAVVEHVRHSIHSPNGEYRAITFCDGEQPVVLCADGTLVDWCAAAALNGRQLASRSDADAFCAAHGGKAHDADENTEAEAYFAHHGELRGCWAGTRKIPFALAIDLNGNGRRDYHEPIVFAAREPWRDVGSDGCPDELEDGKGGCTTADQSPFAKGVKDPNGDDYDAVLNPRGTENNLRWDPGEPFDDVGLDGVPGTGDFGEGDGKYTVAPGLQRWFDGDLRSVLATLPEERLRSIDLYLEGGIRDVFDLGAQAEALAGGVQASMPDGLRAFVDFASIPQAGGSPWPNGKYDPQRIDPAVLGRNTFIPYGNPAASAAAMRSGDGDHVGTVEQVYFRFLTFFRWLSARWDAVLPAQAAHGTGSANLVRHRSQVLGADRDFVVTTPPGYDDPANKDKRYPVLLLLHGYGQGPEDFAGTNLFVDMLANVGQVRELIVVYPDGRCCYRSPAGERVCTERDASGIPWSQRGYTRDCARGSFFVDQAAPGGVRYGAALLETFDEVDKRYRTLAPAVGPAF